MFIYKNLNKKVKRSSLFECLNAIGICEGLDWEACYKFYVNGLHLYANGPSEDEINVKCLLKECGYSPYFGKFNFNKALVKIEDHYYALEKNENDLRQYGIEDPKSLDPASEIIFYVKNNNVNHEPVKRGKHLNQSNTNFTYINCNPKGKYVGDCSIRAIAYSLNLEWDDALDLLAEKAMKLDELHLNSERVVEKVLAEYHYVKHEHFPLLLTCKQFAEKMDALQETGDILLYAGNHHITCLKKVNGHYEIFDTWDCSKEIAGTYFIKEKIKEEIVSYKEKFLMHPSFGEGFVYEEKDRKLYVAFNDQDRVLTVKWVKENCKIL